MADIRIGIRAAEPRDAADLANVWNCPGVVAGKRQLPRRSVEHHREGLEKQEPSVHRLVAVVDNRVLGLLNLHVETNPRRRDCGWFGIGGHDADQGQGMGRYQLARPGDDAHQRVDWATTDDDVDRSLGAMLRIAQDVLGSDDMIGYDQRTTARRAARSALCGGADPSAHAGIRRRDRSRLPARLYLAT